MNKKYSISFVIPVYKSEKSLASVVDEISRINELDWEVILINDDSPDNVKDVILKLIKKYPKRITYLEFRKNYGQHAAIIEGFKYVSKEYVATIDDDGQNPPIEIIKMMRVMLTNDCDVVYGILTYSRHSFFRRFISKINKFVSRATIDNKHNIPITNVRLMKNELASAIANSSGDYGYIDGAIFSLTSHIGVVEVEHKQRINGKSSYNLIKLMKLWFNHLIGYSNIFIKGISLASFFISIATFFIGVVYLLLTINKTGRPSGWLSTYLTMTFLFSILFLILGILTEYIGRMYIKMNQSNAKIINKNRHVKDN